MGKLIRAEPVVPGRAEGVALVSPEPLSFWGGYEAGTGEIVDRRHPLSGELAAGRVLVMPFTRGSSTGSQILLESIRLGKAPAAIVSSRVDPFLALASVVAGELYETPIPILAAGPAAFGLFETGQRLRIDEDGSVHIWERKADGSE